MSQEAILQACKKICLELEGAEDDLKKQLTSIAKHLNRETLSTIGFKFAFLLELQPDSKLVAVSKRDVTSALIDLSSWSNRRQRQSS